MSFTNRITDSDFNNKDISSLPDVPAMGPTDLKARFDANAKEVITPKHNGLASVATSGSYNDLSDTPTIPTQLSQLTGDATHRVVTDAEKSTWNGKVDAVSVSRTGTASSSVTSAQFVSVTDAGGSAVTYEIDGSKYMERKNTSSTSYVFSNSAITTDSTIEVATNTWGDNPSNVTVSNGSCTVTFATATTRNVKIYIR